MASRPADTDLISSLDAMFLALEEGGVHMHVLVVLVLEAGPLRAVDGALDLPRIRRFISDAIDAAPHFRQRLAWVPLLTAPIWVDAGDIDLDAHVRHRRLDPPGDDEALKALVGELGSERLPRDRPLWHLTLVEGLAGDRFAMVFKIHHLILDGRTGVESLAAFFGFAGPPTPRPPAPAPDPLGGIRRVVHELDHRVAAGRELLGWLGGALRRDGVGALPTLARGLYAMARAPLWPSSPTPLNPPRLSPRRRVEWRVLDFAAVRARRQGGATVNDVLLTAATGMLRDFFLARGIPVDGLDLRAPVPVTVARGAGRTNAVIGVIASLPVAAATPAERLRRVTQVTRAIKGGHEGDTMDLVSRVSDLISYRLYGGFLRFAAGRRPSTIIVSDIIGPPVALDLLGARLLAVYPIVPLTETAGLALAFFTYDGRLFCGLNADADVAVDLPRLADDLVAALTALPVSPDP